MRDKMGKWSKSVTGIIWMAKGNEEDHYYYYLFTFIYLHSESMLSPLLTILKLID